MSRKRRPGPRPRAIPAAPEAPHRGAAGVPRRLLAIAWAVLASLVVWSYWNVLRLDFSNDDFLILENVALRSGTRMMAWSHMIAGYWRPWSRDLHFWVLSRLFGFDAAAFHAANVVLWLAVLGVLLVLLRRLTDARLSVIVVAGAFAAASWGIYLTWACCSQDLWMLLLGELFLLAQLGGRRWLAPLWLALALLSKETAALMLPIAAWMQLTLHGRASLRMRDWAAPLCVTAAWLTLHPSLGGRILFHGTSRFEPALSGEFPLRSLLSPFNLEWWPAPRNGWTPALIAAVLVWAAALGILAWSALRPRGSQARANSARSRWIALGLGWWAISWSPLLVAPRAWHAYYGWFGTCGAWLALAAWLLPRPRVLATAITFVAALRAPAAATLVDEWGTESFQRLANARTVRIRDQLLALHPTLPRHARIFVAGVPSGSGLLTGRRYSAAAHVWYRDLTVSMAGLSNYWARTAEDSLGPDYFCALDREMHMVPVATGVFPVPDSLRRDAVWEPTEELVGAKLGEAGDWPAAMKIFRGLATTYPDTARLAFDLGIALDRLGDTTAAGPWLDRADSLVGAPPSRGRGFMARYIPSQAR